MPEGFWLNVLLVIEDISAMFGWTRIERAAADHSRRIHLRNLLKP